ncbi:DUF6893 family small protein [Actinomadura meridiana]
MRKMWIAVGCVTAAGLLTLVWKETPAMRRYLRIERM